MDSYYSASPEGEYLMKFPSLPHSSEEYWEGHRGGSPPAHGQGSPPHATSSGYPPPSSGPSPGHRRPPHRAPPPGHAPPPHHAPGHPPPGHPPSPGHPGQSEEDRFHAWLKSPEAMAAFQQSMGKGAAPGTAPPPGLYDYQKPVPATAPPGGPPPYTGIRNDVERSVSPRHGPERGVSPRHRPERGVSPRRGPEPGVSPGSPSSATRGGLYSMDSLEPLYNLERGSSSPESYFAASQEIYQKQMADAAAARGARDEEYYKFDEPPPAITPKYEVPTPAKSPYEKSPYEQTASAKGTAYEAAIANSKGPPAVTSPHDPSKGYHTKGAFPYDSPYDKTGYDKLAYDKAQYEKACYEKAAYEAAMGKSMAHYESGKGASPYESSSAKGYEASPSKGHPTSEKGGYEPSLTSTKGHETPGSSVKGYDAFYGEWFKKTRAVTPPPPPPPAPAAKGASSWWAAPSQSPTDRGARYHHEMLAAGHSGAAAQSEAHSAAYSAHSGAPHSGGAYSGAYSSGRPDVHSHSSTGSYPPAPSQHSPAYSLHVNGQPYPPPHLSAGDVTPPGFAADGHHVPPHLTRGGAPAYSYGKGAYGKDGKPYPHPGGAYPGGVYKDGVMVYKNPSKEAYSTEASAAYELYRKQQQKQQQEMGWKGAYGQPYGSPHSRGGTYVNGYSHSHHPHRNGSKEMKDLYHHNYYSLDDLPRKNTSKRSAEKAVTPRRDPISEEREEAIRKQVLSYIAHCFGDPDGGHDLLLANPTEMELAITFIFSEACERTIPDLREIENYDISDDKIESRSPSKDNREPYSPISKQKLADLTEERKKMKAYQLFADIVDDLKDHPCLTRWADDSNINTRWLQEDDYMVPIRKQSKDSRERKQLPKRSKDSFLRIVMTVCQSGFANAVEELNQYYRKDYIKANARHARDVKEKKESEVDFLPDLECIKLIRQGSMEVLDDYAGPAFGKKKNDGHGCSDDESYKAAESRMAEIARRMSFSQLVGDIFVPRRRSSVRLDASEITRDAENYRQLHHSLTEDQRIEVLRRHSLRCGVFMAHLFLRKLLSVKAIISLIDQLLNMSVMESSSNPSGAPPGHGTGQRRLADQAEPHHTVGTWHSAGTPPSAKRMLGYTDGDPANSTSPRSNRDAKSDASPTGGKDGLTSTLNNYKDGFPYSPSRDVKKDVSPTSPSSNASSPKRGPGSGKASPKAAGHHPSSPSRSAEQNNLGSSGGLPTHLDDNSNAGPISENSIENSGRIPSSGSELLTSLSLNVVPSHLEPVEQIISSPNKNTASQRKGSSGTSSSDRHGSHGDTNSPYNAEKMHIAEANPALKAGVVKEDDNTCLTCFAIPMEFQVILACHILAIIGARLESLSGATGQIKAHLSKLLWLRNLQYRKKNIYSNDTEALIHNTLVLQKKNWKRPEKFQENSDVPLNVPSVTSNRFKENPKKKTHSPRSPIAGSPGRALHGGDHAGKQDASTSHISHISRKGHTGHNNMGSKRSPRSPPRASAAEAIMAEAIMAEAMMQESDVDNNVETDDQGNPVIEDYID